MSYNLYQRGRGWPSIFFLAALVGFLIGAFIEFFQLYSPTRVGEVTDALLYCMGGFLGTFSLYYIIHEVRPALDYEYLVPKVL